MTTFPRYYTQRYVWTTRWKWCSGTR